MAAGQRKPEVQWTADERKAANLDQRLKSLIMFVLPDDQMNSVINCLTAKSTWDDLILYHEGPSDVKESRVIDLKLCHNTFKFKEVKVLMALAKDNDAVSKEGARNGEWVKISMRKCDSRKPIWYLDSGCSRHMTGVKSYLHKYIEQPGHKVVFRDDSTCVTEGYGSIKCNGIVFTKVAFVNGLKYNLISISQLCDAKYIVQFDKKRGTIFNSNKEIVMIAPRLAKQNLVMGLPFLVYSKDKQCSSCKKGKHHRASLKTKQTFSIKKCLHLLHMDLFGLVTSRSINHEKYTLVIVDEYSRSTIVKIHLKIPYEIFRGRIPNIDFLHVFGCPVYIHKHKDYLGKFDEKADDGYFLGYSLVSKGFRVFNTRKQQTEETYHITFDESTDPIKFSKSSVDNINIAESERYPPDEYIYHYEPSQKYQVNSNEVSFIDPYERPDSVVLETESPSDQNDQSDQNDHHAQENDIPNDNPPEHSNHNNDSPIIENLINAEMVQESEPTSSLVEDA
ncbi:retrovirus-related pol polyprotein from transposon TNT 1-94 [Tanacetum coccineum]